MMELSAVPPMPLDFSVPVRGRTESPAQDDRLINENIPSSSAFRVVTPKGRIEGQFIKFNINFFRSS